MDAIAAATGYRATRCRGPWPRSRPCPDRGCPTAALEPPAPPAPRPAERQAARSGALAEAAPVITQGASLPLAGTLVVLPALAATGLIEAATKVYSTARATFYGLRSLVLTVVFTALPATTPGPRTKGAPCCGRSTPAPPTSRSSAMSCTSGSTLSPHPAGPRQGVAALCEGLNATETTYPGTELRLVYSAKSA